MSIYMHAYVYFGLLLMISIIIIDLLLMISVEYQIKFVFLCEIVLWHFGIIKIISSVLPLRSVGRSNFDKGWHNLTTLIQNPTFINELLNYIMVSTVDN